MKDILKNALRYARLGWRIIPLHSVGEDGSCSCLNPACESQGKHPRIMNWPKQATIDEETIQKWWSMWPGSNVGFATGDGLIDIEFEGHGDGEENLRALEKKLGPLPDTVTWTSGGGGTHQLFKTTKPISSRTAGTSGASRTTRPASRWLRRSNGTWSSYIDWFRCATKRSRPNFSARAKTASVNSRA